MSTSCRNCESIDVLPPKPQLQHIMTSDSLVSEILRGSRPLLDSDRDVLNAEIVELEQLQSLYAAQPEEIRLCHCTVLKALENRQSIYAPIRCLPRDTLIEIFHYVCDSWWEANDNWTWRDGDRHHSLDVFGPLWILSRVCGLWRDILHSSPASWARKVVVQGPFSKSAPGIMLAYLEHTGEHLLDLQVFCSKSEKADKILSLLVPSHRRWKTLSIDAAKLHMPHFESISHFPSLQAIDIEINDGYGSDFHSAMCLRAPQLWQASLHGHGIHQIELPTGITHFSGSITCPEDLHLLAELPNLRRCHLWMRLSMKEVSVVTLAQLTHLYVMDLCVLGVISAPLLTSLALDPSQEIFFLSTDHELLPRFLHRSRCRLDSLSFGMKMFMSTIPSSVFTSEACSIVSRLKFELFRGMDGVEGLASPSVLPNLRHLILCISHHTADDWDTVRTMVRSRRDAGMLKLLEVQFEEEMYTRLYDVDIKDLIKDDFEARLAQWNPPGQDYRSLSGML